MWCVGVVCGCGERGECRERMIHIVGQRQTNTRINSKVITETDFLG